ncbi:uncharacterized protein [Watersipora subatra]|uniref:uncharacterized protein n=1 Tax=Watersipora subatra TaxID=2589382 RepID=UPI00355C9177
MIDFLDKFTQAVKNATHVIDIPAVDAFVHNLDLKVKDIGNLYNKIIETNENEKNPTHEQLLNEFQADVKSFKTQIQEQCQEESEILAEEKALEDAKRRMEEEMRAYTVKRQNLLRRMESSSVRVNRLSSPSIRATASSTPNTDRYESSSAPSAIDSINLREPQVGIGTRHILKAFTDNLAESFNAKMNSSTASVSKPNRKSVEPSIFSGDTLEFADWEVDMDAFVFEEGLTDREALRYLKKFVAGEAKKAIIGLLTYSSDNSYQEAREKLRDRYSMEGGIARILLKKLENWPNIRSGDGKKMREFGDFLDQVRRSMSSTEGLQILNTELYNERICQKLPDSAKFSWTQRVCRAKRMRTGNLSFSDFTEFVLEQADCYMSNIMASQSKDQKHDQPKSKGRYEERTNRRAASYQTERTRREPFCYFCNGNDKGHYTRDCRKLAEKSLKERKDFVHKKGLCFSCLNGKHRSSICNRKQTCSNCHRMHPTMLHDPDWKPTEKSDSQRNSSQQPTTSNQGKEQTKTKTCNSTGVYGQSSFSMMVPVYVSAGNNEKLVYALLDTLSDITFIDKQTAMEIGASGIPDTLNLETMNAISRSSTLRYEKLQIRGYLTDEISTIDAVERPEIKCHSDNIPTDEKCRKIPHLRSLARHLPPKLDIPIGLMIGKDSPEIITPLLTKRGEAGETSACKTMFGWTLCGGKLKTKLATSFKTDATLFPIVEQDFEDPGGKPLSQQDMQFLKILDEGIHQDPDGSYVMPLPFKSSSTPILPNNRHQAEQRLGLLKNKLLKDSAYEADYRKFMNTLFEKGFAEEVPVSEMVREDDNIEISKSAAEFLKDNFYVDDGIFSVDDIRTAKDLVNSAREICSKGNLRLHKYVSNEPAALADLPESEKETEAISFNSIMPTQRTLGVSWCLQSDQLCFTSNIDARPLSRRGILSTVAQVYDPIGLVSPFTLMGKNVLQDPKDFGTIKRAELHHFADASEDGYGACSYIRLIDTTDRIHCALVLSKARVAPLNRTTIPRMELQGAVLATKLQGKLHEELRMPIDGVFFWTDSMIVLGYIRNETSRFSPFVANRATQIRHRTKPAQWNHVPGIVNPADMASRGATIHQLTNSHWFCGPDFLWKENLDDILLNQPTRFNVAASDPELRKTIRVDMNQVTYPIKVENFSKWDNLIRATAQLRAVAKRAKDKLKPIWKLEKMSREHSQDAEALLIRLDQQKYFHSEILDIQAHGRMDTAGLRTAMYEICSIINGKPLTCSNLNNPDEGVITPHHLITMKPVSVPTHQEIGEVPDGEVYGKNMFEKTQRFANEFWRHWQDYLTKVETRQKWRNPCQNLKVGDVVAVVDENTWRSQWKVGAVDSVNTGRDGLVRSATVRISNPEQITRSGKRKGEPNMLYRPIQKLLLLVSINSKY